MLSNCGFCVNGHCPCSVTVFLISTADIRVFIHSFSNSLNTLSNKKSIFCLGKVIDGSIFWFCIYISYACLVLDTGMSQLQFGALELSQSQDFESDFMPSEGDVRHQFHLGAPGLVKNDAMDGT